jgi:hypothetical protein
MSEDNKKQNEPEEQKETSADVKQVPGGARELSADELEEVVGGFHKANVPTPPPPPPPPPPHPWPETLWKD